MAKRMKAVEAWAVVSEGGFLVASPMRSRPMIYWTEAIGKAARRDSNRLARVRIVEIAPKGGRKGRVG